MQLNTFLQKGTHMVSIQQECRGYTIVPSSVQNVNQVLMFKICRLSEKSETIEIKTTYTLIWYLLFTTYMQLFTFKLSKYSLCFLTFHALYMVLHT